jgi:hypothetical protein
VHFAQRRVQRLGWENACHQTALEILGYRFNRAPMLRIAEQWPLPAWSEADFDVQVAFTSERGRWSLQGVRPANHPQVRLRQYTAWTRARPEWPARWANLASTLGPVDAAEPTRVARRKHSLGATREHLSAEICAGRISGTRLDNLICDGLLPLGAAQNGGDFFGRWFHWFAGDQPPALMRVLRQLNVFDQRAQPACHGFAQGLFSWFIKRELRG